MTYRDDLDAAQARVAALEQELAATKSRLTEAEDRRSTALVKVETSVTTALTATRAARTFGAPLRVRLARSFDGDLDPAVFEDLVELIRTTTSDAGRTEIMKGSLLWTSGSPPNGLGPFITVVVTARKGKVTLTVEDRFGNLAGIVYGAVGGGVFGSAVIVPVLATIAMPLLAPVAFGAWFGGGFAACRAMFRRAARKRADKAHVLFDVLVEELAKRVTAAAAGAAG